MHKSLKTSECTRAGVHPDIVAASTPVSYGYAGPPQPGAMMPGQGQGQNGKSAKRKEKKERHLSTAKDKIPEAPLKTPCSSAHFEFAFDFSSSLSACAFFSFIFPSIHCYDIKSIPSPKK